MKFEIFPIEYCEYPNYPKSSQNFHLLTAYHAYSKLNRMPQTTNPDDWHRVTDCEILARLATSAALSANWQEAAKINQKILTFIQNDVEALNRLARAFACLGHAQKAVKLYKKALEIDPYNTIARKNLDKITKADGNSNGKSATITSGPGTSSSLNPTSLFLFEPGKTKVVTLLNIAQPSVLSTLTSGEKLVINPKNHSVTIASSAGVYLGALPDDLAHRLLGFIAGGNIYEAYVKSATPKSLSVVIRETFRSPKFVNQPSFQANSHLYFDFQEQE